MERSASTHPIINTGIRPGGYARAAQYVNSKSSKTAEPMKARTM